MKKRYLGGVFRRILLSIALLYPGLMHAQFQQQPPQEEKELSPVTRAYAITNATVMQAPGRKVEQATVVIRDGLITAVGKNVAIPPDAVIIKGDSLHVYAGFIDGLSRVGVTKPKEDSNRERPKDPGNPAPEAAGITPQNDVRSFLNPADKTVDELRALGFAAAHVVPYGQMLPGSGAVVLLSGKSVDAMVIAPKASFFSELTGAQRVYPSTVIAVMAKWRELYKQAVLSKNYESLYAANRTGIARPTTDRILEAFYPVIEKKVPVFFEADRYLETQRIMTLQSELGFSLVMGDLKEGWDAIPKIKSSGARVFLSLDLPAEKKDDKKDSKDKKDIKPDTDKSAPSTLTPAEKEALEKRKAEFIGLYTGQAAAFQKAGIAFGFSSLSAKPADIRKNLQRMIKAGLTEDQALGALTTSPAQLLGLSDRLGSVDNGKIANLVLSDKPYFNEKSKVKYVFVDGTLYKYETPDTKPDAAKTEIAGTWSVTTETPAGKNEESLTFTKDGANYAGSLTGGKLPQAVALEKVELNGKSLKYNYTVQMGGQSYKVDVEATVDGNSFKGTAAMGQQGSFAVEAKKTPNN